MSSQPGDEEVEVWDLSAAEPGLERSRKFDRAREDEELIQNAKLTGSSSPEDSELNRQLQRENDNHKREMEKEKAAFERQMEMFRVIHDRRTNYGILVIVSILFLLSVGVLSLVAYQASNENTLRDKAITLLAPLTGLALGFLSGKIKWPAL